MSYKVETIPEFDKQAKRLSKKYPSLKKDLAALIASLSETPLEGKRQIRRSTGYHLFEIDTNKGLSDGPL